ncbi:hypothetical protein CEXT_757661 [Caerostris extrusa]|uniref:Uncharacterized protein n=1 Tax=Caerostris extrusa TaxID=172846 RepID=A0AAV4YFG7_CAEEX|nr:hypothetical protein CEXT_757661 [Caerostris extrusa]
MRTRINFTVSQRALQGKKKRSPKCSLSMRYVVTQRKPYHAIASGKYFIFDRKPRLSCQSRSRKDELQRYYITPNKATQCYLMSIRKATSDGAKLTANTQITSFMETTSAKHKTE